MFDFFLPASVWGAFAVLQKFAEYGIDLIMPLPVSILTKIIACCCFAQPERPQTTVIPCNTFWKKELTFEICLKTEIVILPIMALNSQKKFTIMYVSKSYLF